MAPEIRKTDDSLSFLKETKLLYGVIAFLWLWFSLPLLKAEWLCLEQAPDLWKKSSFEKRVALDGFVYVLSLASQEAVPPHAKAAFIAPSMREDEKSYYDLKFHYYLWPRTISVFNAQNLDKSVLENFDYVLSLGVTENYFSDTPSFEKIFDFQKGAPCFIYRNNNRIRS